MMVAFFDIDCDSNDDDTSDDDGESVVTEVIRCRLQLRRGDLQNVVARRPFSPDLSDFLVSHKTCPTPQHSRPHQRFCLLS